MPSVAPQNATVTAPATGTSSALVLAAGAVRNGAIIVNDSAAVLYLRFGSAAASSTDYTLFLAAGAAYTMSAPTYGGAIQGILASGTGTARVTTY